MEQDKEKETPQHLEEDDKNKKNNITPISMDKAKNMAVVESIRQLDKNAPCAPVYDPMNTLQRSLEILEREQLYHTRKQKFGEESIGIDLTGSTVKPEKKQHFLYGCAGSEFSLLEEFSAFCMCQYMKHLLYTVLLDKVKPEEELLKKTMELVNHKYFNYEEKDPQAKRKFFHDIERQRKEQTGRVVGFQKFMGEFSDFKKLYERLLKKYGVSKGIYCPEPAIFSIIYCNKSRSATSKRFDEIKKGIGVPMISGKPVFRMYAIGHTGNVLPFNPCANKSSGIEISDPHMQAMYDNVQRNMQLRSQRYVDKERESIDEHIMSTQSK